MKQINNQFIYITLIFSLCLTGCFTNKSLREDKQQRWQAMEKEVSSWGDALGMPIDHGIKNMVIVLNLLGFKTRASCEGHLDHGLAYPWIDFDLKNQEITVLQDALNEIYKKIDDKEAEIRKKYPEITPGKELQKDDAGELTALYSETFKVKDKIEKLAKLQLLPLKDLLDIFYKNRPTNPDRMIRIHEYNPTFLRMYSVGGDWQIVRDDNDKTAKMKGYQQEMQEFVDFLTKYYFGSKG